MIRLQHFCEQVEILRQISESDDWAKQADGTETMPESFEARFLPIWKRRHELYAVWVASQIRAGFLGAKVD